MNSLNVFKLHRSKLTHLVNEYLKGENTPQTRAAMVVFYNKFIMPSSLAPTFLFPGSMIMMSSSSFRGTNANAAKLKEWPCFYETGIQLVYDCVCIHH